MSAYTLAELNDGRILTRLPAWWYEQGHTTRDGQSVLYPPETYPHGIPVADVKRRLFPWEVFSSPVTYTVTAPDGTERTFTDASRQVIGRADTGALFGVFSDAYVPHDYAETLLDTLAAVVSESTGDLVIAAAGELAGGAEAWVSIEANADMFTRSDVVFKPYILGSTSLNGKLATSYTNCVTLAVCDNTRAAALGEKSAQVKFRHTKDSAARIVPGAKEALGLLEQTADTFSEQLDMLLSLPVTEAQWTKVLDTYAPAPDADDTKRAATMKDTKRGEVNALWTTDERVTPWRGTAFGALQALNTYETHVLPTRGDTSRADRNVRDALCGKLDTREADNRALVLASAS